MSWFMTQRTSQKPEPVRTGICCRGNEGESMTYESSQRGKPGQGNKRSITNWSKNNKSNSDRCKWRSHHFAPSSSNFTMECIWQILKASALLLKIRNIFPFQKIFSKPPSLLKRKKKPIGPSAHTFSPPTFLHEYDETMNQRLKTKKEE